METAQFLIITRVVIYLYHKEQNNEKLSCFFIVFLCYYIFTLVQIWAGVFFAPYKKAFAFQSIEAKGGIKQVFENVKQVTSK